MKINVCVFEPDGKGFTHFLYDPIKNLVAAMRDLGHEVRLQRNVVERGQLNILCGAHQIVSPATVRSLLSAGISYVLYQTEVLHLGQVNAYGQDHFTECYLPILQGASVIWDWSPDQVETLRRDGYQAELVQIGFHPDLREIRPARHKSIGALFFGSVTPYRAQVFEALRARQIPIHVAFDEVAFYRNDMMAVAKLVLSVPQVRGGHLNAYRIMAAVNNGVFCLGERAGNRHWIDECFAQAEPEALADALVGALADPDLEVRAAEQFEHLSRFPTTTFVEPLLERLAQAL
jgi:hypothetical protein